MIKHCPYFAEKLAQRFLEPGDGVLDIGAADGEYTRIYAARVGPTGEVLAVEPSARNRTKGQALCPSWVRWSEAAVGAAEGSATLFVPRRYPKTASLYAGNVRKGTRVDVPLTTIDALMLSMRQTPALIQVDAQGAEAAILGGAKRTLALPIVWIVEVWPRGLIDAGASVEKVIAPFRKRGFMPEAPSGQGMTWSGVQREVQRVGPSPHGHFDLVFVPAALQVAVSA